MATIENPERDEANIPPEPKKEVIPVKANGFSGMIIKQIVEKLGRPKNLIKFTVTNVYDNRYRINAFVNPERPTISDSFFVRISSVGEIVYANPDIVRKY